ncbi:MAG TPA: adenylate/guanylate cyclase domain-containing protein [Candidatus Limnocylindria bacterium]|nr:adenylate/guanylate cyclase domain-containing protein [Candidatus Limnocylindria bacterium]
MTTSSAARRRAACASCGATVRAKDRFCASCGAPIAAANAPAPGTAAPAAPASASLQVPALDASALGEQRKVVTILFADLSGSTPLGERLDPEDLRRILASYFNQLARQIRRYEGTIDKYIGDAVMAVFGAPLSHEDDAERAIRAALAMRDGIAKLNDDLERAHGVRLALRIGINTGEVVAGMLGGDVQSAYTVVGDAVNTAQRLEAAAPLGQVIVSETTRRLALHAFEFERLDPVQLKGKATAVAAYRVVRRRDEEIEPDASPLVGREREIARLRAILVESLTGAGRVVHVSGEAGVGKSRVVTEFRTELAGGVERMSARCVSYETNTPYALIASLLRGAFRIHAADGRESARAGIVTGFARFGHPVEVPAIELLLDVLGYGESAVQDPQLKQRLLIALLHGLLGAAAQRAPFVIVAEDLHWIDDASLQVLVELVPMIAAAPGMFITTARAPWSPPWTAEHLPVEPLDESSARSLVEAIVEMTVAPDLVAAILSRTGGNPFFIEEVVRELQETGGLREAGGVLTGAADVAGHLPATIQDVLEARLDRLDDGAKRVVRPAAVIGRTFWARLLDRLVDVPLAPSLARLEQEAFIVTRAVRPELTYAFRQALIQEVAYETQLLSDRRRMHTRIGAAIESLYTDRLDEFMDLLAYHYERGEDEERAIHWLVRAADRAKSLFANGEALALYGAALSRMGEGRAELAASVRERMGDVQLLVGRYDDALASFAAAREGDGATPVRRARMWRKAASALLLKSDYGSAADALAQARAAVAGLPEIEAAQVELQAGQLAWRRGDYSGARQALSVAVQSATVLAERDAEADVVIAEGLKQLGNVSFLAGRREDAEQYYRESLEIYDRRSDAIGRANVHSNLGVVYRRMGRWDDALRELAASLELRHRIGDPWGIGTTHNNIGEVHRSRGELAPAIAAYERALAVWTPIGYTSGVALAQTGLGAAIADAGDPARGLAVLREAEARWATLGSTTYLPDLYRFIASAELALGDLEAAATAAGRSLELARGATARHQEAMTLRVQGEIRAAQDDVRGARELLERSRAILVELDEPAELARTDTALARLGARS